MHTSREQLNPTTVKLTITADADELGITKELVLKRLGRQMKLSGFRPGKAPLSLVERNADPNTLQSEFLNEMVNRLYGKAVDQEQLRTVGQPNVTLQKFVPFSQLEMTAETEMIGDIKLPDYTKFKLAKQPVSVTDKDVDEVVENLRTQAAKRSKVERPAKNGDEVVIDFIGKDSKTGEPVKGADGKQYPLALGSDSFIPGFEANLIGIKPGEQKTFEIAFPKDYGVKALQNRKVTFTVSVNEVHELTKPVVDDAFAATVGPFKTADDLRADIRTQLTSEKEREVAREFENKLLDTLAAKTTVAVPEQLVNEEIEQMIRQTRQNLTYRGQTWQEYLDELGQTDEDYRKSQHDTALQRVKAGLALSQVAEKEKLTVTPEEFKIRQQLLKGQYTDKQMQAELEKPENARTILAGILSEKTLAKLTEYVTTQ